MQYEGSIIWIREYPRTYLRDWDNTHFAIQIGNDIITAWTIKTVYQHLKIGQKVRFVGDKITKDLIESEIHCIRGKMHMSEYEVVVDFGHIYGSMEEAYLLRCGVENKCYMSNAHYQQLIETHRCRRCTGKEEDTNSLIIRVAKYSKCTCFPCINKRCQGHGMCEIPPS